MAKKSARTFSFDASPERFLELMIDPGFQVAREKVQAAKDAEVVELERTDSKLRYEVRTTEYGKGLTGVDKSKTEQTLSVYEWDLDNKTASWTWSGPYGKKVKVWGHLAIRPVGTGVQLDSDFNVDVKIPLIGGKIEKAVIKETEKGWGRYENVIKEWLA